MAKHKKLLAHMGAIQKSFSGIGGFLLCIMGLVNLLSFGSGCLRNR